MALYEDQHSSLGVGTERKERQLQVVWDKAEDMTGGLELKERRDSEACLPDCLADMDRFSRELLAETNSRL